MSLPAAVYRPRNPQLSDYYRCVEDYFETFVRVYEEYFSRLYGFWRPYIEQVIYRFLDCGDPHSGFARVKLVLDLIGDARIAAMNICWHSLVNEGIPIFMGTSFCPSCHQKRVVEFGEWLCMDVLKKIPHRHFVFSIPKILRRYFLYDRKLLADPRLRGDKP